MSKGPSAQSRAARPPAPPGAPISPLHPRPTLFRVLLGILGLWIAALLAMVIWT
jgi:hypothetical protein